MLNQKERTTVERKIKQLVKDLNDDLQDVNNNRISQTNTTQTSSSSTLESSQNNQSTKKSTFALFLNSVSTSTTRTRSMCATTNNTSSIPDEFLLYKSLAIKEVQKIVETDSNPDASGFW